MRACVQCGKAIAPKKPWGRFCSVACKNENYLDMQAVTRLPQLFREGRVQLHYTPPPPDEPEPEPVPA